MIDLVFLDVDGTLVGSTGRVSRPVLDAIDRVREAGVHLSVCTGRPHTGLAGEIATRVDARGRHIFDAGALVTNGDGDPIRADTLGRESLDVLVDQLDVTDAVLELYSTDGIYVSRLDDDCAWHAEMLQIEVEEANLRHIAREHDIVKAHWIMGSEQVDATLDFDSTGMEVGVATSPVLPGLVFASVTRADVSKATAARFVAEYFDVSPANAMAIGDSPGDLPILEAVGHPRVMGNADADLRDRFPTIPSIDRDGVVSALEAIFG